MARHGRLLIVLTISLCLVAALPVLAQASRSGKRGQAIHHVRHHRKRHCALKRRRGRSLHHLRHTGRKASCLARTRAKHLKFTSSTPTAPSNLAATGEQQAVALSWTASTDSVDSISAYDVYRNNSMVGQTSSTNYLDGGLTDGTSYSYYVVAVDSSGGVSKPSSTVSAIPVDSIPPSAPTNLAAIGGNGQASLTWSASTDNVAVAGYDIFRNGAEVAQTTGTSFADAGLSNGTSYSYYVKAYDAAGNVSASSNAVSVIPVAPATGDATPPTVPANLDGVPGNTQVSLSWSASSDDTSVAGYHVYRNGSLVGSPAGTTYTDTGLSDGTSYSYSVTAYDPAGHVSGASSAISVTPTSLNPSGQQLTFGDASGWHQVFADNFMTAEPIGSFSGCVTNAVITNQYCSGLAGSSYYNSWSAYSDGWSGTPTTGTYYPSQTMSVQNGMLDYYIHTATISGTAYHMIDAALPKIPGSGTPDGGLLYGRYVIRARWDALNGYHVSFLLWPDSGRWPKDGEIDFPEADFDSTTISAFMHYQNATCGCQQDGYSVKTNPQQWHTYEIDWLPSAVSFYLDGQLIGRSTSNIPNTPMHWVLQTGTSFSEPTPSNSTAGHVQIAWAAAYKPA